MEATGVEPMGVMVSWTERPRPAAPSKKARRFSPGGAPLFLRGGCWVLSKRGRLWF
jgi:hypothetical protein